MTYLTQRLNYNNFFWKFNMVTPILNFQKPDFWAMGPLGLLICHHCTKFGAKMLIDADIMAENRNIKSRPSVILDFRKSNFWALAPLGLPIFHHCTTIWHKYVDRRQNYGRKSKSKMASVRRLGFVTSSYRTTHEVYSLGYIGISNFCLLYTSPSPRD